MLKGTNGYVDAPSLGSLEGGSEGCICPRMRPDRRESNPDSHYIPSDLSGQGRCPCSERGRVSTNQITHAKLPREGSPE